MNGKPLDPSLRLAVEKRVDDGMPDWKIARQVDVNLHTIALIRREHHDKAVAETELERLNRPSSRPIPEATLLTQLETIAACWRDCREAGPAAIARSVYLLLPLLSGFDMPISLGIELGEAVRGWQEGKLSTEHLGRWLDHSADQLRIKKIGATRRRSVA